MMRTTASESGTREIVSTFQLIVLAGLRVKQLQRGSKPRIEADPNRRRNTSIALEEVKRGLVKLAQSAVLETHNHPTNTRASGSAEADLPEPIHLIGLKTDALKMSGSFKRNEGL